MKISTATSVLANYLLKDAVNEVVRLGFDGVDIWCGRPHMYRQDNGAAELAALGERLREQGVKAVTAMPAFFRYPFSLSSPVETIRRDSIAYMRECIENASSVGADNVLVVPGNAVFGQSPEDARRLFIKSVEGVCKFACDRSIKLGVEILYEKLSSYMHTYEQALSLIAELGSDMVGVVADTGHIALGGADIEETVDALGDKLLEVHINDNDGISQQNAIPGHGTIDFERVSRVLEAANYQGFVTLEIGWQYSFDPTAALAESLDNVRRVFG